MNEKSLDTLDLYEYVSRPLRNGKPGYWRRVPFTRYKPSLGQLEARMSFAVASQEAVDSKGLHVAAKKVKEVMKNTRMQHHIVKPVTLPYPLLEALKSVNAKMASETHHTQTLLHEP